MAGAISAGAYTAGVVDFLIEALDAWEAAKADPQFSGPRHDVLITTMTGASAGAMTSAIAAVALHSETRPVRDVDHPPPAELNRLFESWVRRIDIRLLLDTRDLQNGATASSLLDSSELAAIAESALRTQSRAEPRRYVADPLAVFLTVANLRGVPYGFDLYGAPGGRPYGMLAHADYVRFSVSRTARTIPGACLLDPKDVPGSNWPLLARAALASGAFPIGLSPRELARPFADYDEHYSVKPKWPKPIPADPYRFLCVDGGLMNNEPLELARRHLAGGGRNPREGTAARRAIVMVDPFPNHTELMLDYAPDNSLMSVIGSMFGALVNQARFKPEELQLAQDPDVYSRFMISPSRVDANDRNVEPAMASAILGGFGGFLSEAFRKHDFQLGRRNCQNFLRRHFCLPETNPLFGSWADQAARAPYYVRDSGGSLVPFSESDRTSLLPIIPLVGEVADTIPQYRTPHASAVDMPSLDTLIKARISAVGAALIENDLSSVIGGSAARWTARKIFDLKIAPRLRDKARQKIRSELERLG